MKDVQKGRRNIRRRKGVARLAQVLFTIAAFLGVALLVILLYQIIHDGAGSLKWHFLTSFPSRIPSQAGIKSALVGSAYLVVLTAILSLPVGVGAAIYLEEFAGKSWINKAIQINISNLSGVPSIVYGLLGLAVFVRFFNLERSLISGALTMSLLLLPMVIIASQEAIRSVPNSIRQAALAVGATRWQAVRDHVLPSALPGILTGVILSMSRAIGETAPLIMIGALNYVAFTPKSLKDGFTALPIQIFNWATRPQSAFHDLAAGGIIVLVVVLLSMNAVAILLRHRAQRRIKW